MRWLEPLHWDVLASVTFVSILRSGKKQMIYMSSALGLCCSKYGTHFSTGWLTSIVDAFECSSRSVSAVHACIYSVSKEKWELQDKSSLGTWSTAHFSWDHASAYVIETHFTWVVLATGYIL